MFWKGEHDAKDCLHCHAPLAEHEWRCTACGTQSTELGTCDCGKCVMPRRACECHAGISLFCPELLRVVAQDEEDSLRYFLQVYAEAGTDLHWMHQWELDEMERVRSRCQRGGTC